MPSPRRSELLAILVGGGAGALARAGLAHAFPAGNMLDAGRAGMAAAYALASIAVGYAAATLATRLVRS